MVDIFFDRKSSGSGVKSKIIKPRIRKFEKRKVNSSFKHNIWDAHLPNIKLISKFDREFLFLLCVILVNMRALGIHLSQATSLY